MESVWGGATAAPSFPSWSAAQIGHPIQQPQSLWSEPVTKGIKTEQEILVSLYYTKYFLKVPHIKFLANENGSGSYPNMNDQD